MVNNIKPGRVAQVGLQALLVDAGSNGYDTVSAIHGHISVQGAQTMPQRTAAAAALVLLCLAAVGGIGGCSSVYMKGTPLYTGEYSKPQGPAENRVNLWPLAYYHDPALSVLWPLGSFTDDHFAIRPVFTIYKLDMPRHEYNVFWPIVQFDNDVNQHRVAPVFWWGDATWHKYFVAFPLLWCVGPKAGGVFEAVSVFPLFWYDKGKYVALFPFYIRSKEPGSTGGGSTHVLWPIFNVKNESNSSGWRIWPFYGKYAAPSGDDLYRFAMWPLFNQWLSGDHATVAAIPVYFSRHEGTHGWKLLLPFYFGRRDAGSRMFVTPLLARSQSGNRGAWVLPWLLTWHTHQNWLPATGDTPPDSGGAPFLGKRDLWALGGLIHSGRSADDAGEETRTSHVIPLYYHNSSGNLFLSLPYSRWMQGDKGFVSAAGPLYMHGWSGDDSWRLIFPLLFQEKSSNESSFVTPLLSRYSGGGTSTWMLTPLVSWVTASGKERDMWLLGPLAHARWGGDNHSSHVFPLYCYSGYAEAFVTPLFCYTGWSGSRPVFISPLYMSSGNASGGWKVVPPIFFWNHSADSSLFISPLYAHSRTPEHRTSVLPPLLSWVRRSKGSADWWILGGVAHAKSSADGSGQSHLFPFYYSKPRSGTFLTPLFGWTGAGCAGPKTTYVGGPLYVYAQNESQEGRWYLPFPFISGCSTEQKKSYWAWPLGSYNNEKSGAGTHGYAAWPLFWYSFKPDYSKFGLFPVFYSGYTKERHRPHDNPQVERTVERKRFLSLPIFWYQRDVNAEKAQDCADVRITGRNVNTGCLVFWHYKSDESDARSGSDFRILGWLYDCRSRRHPALEQKGDAGQATTQGEGAEDYVRSRILWRVMHYERLNERSSLDIFPFITYDSHKDSEFRKFSFLWRFVRYERTDKGGLKLDLLFIPLSRSAE